MQGFKVVCNQCGKESIIQQCNGNVDVKGDIKIEYWDRPCDTISFVCECGNKVEDE